MIVFLSFPISNNHTWIEKILKKIYLKMSDLFTTYKDPRKMALVLDSHQFLPGDSSQRRFTDNLGTLCNCNAILLQKQERVTVRTIYKLAVALTFSLCSLQEDC